MLAFRILHEDEFLIAVDKPAGFHSHAPEDKAIRISPRWNGLSILERQLNQKLYPTHRLDRATSGILLLSKVRALNSNLQGQFAERRAKKIYYCLVRGRLQGNCEINEPLKNEKEQMEEAVTKVEEVFAFTLPIPGPGGGNRVFTMVRAEPVTGRFHQIRRHLAGLSLPIVGDSRHGDRRLNREFATFVGLDRMFLRCLRLTISHPQTGESLKLQARWSKDWHRIFERAGYCPIL